MTWISLCIPRNSKKISIYLQPSCTTISHQFSILIVSKNQFRSQKAQAIFTYKRRISFDDIRKLHRCMKRVPFNMCRRHCGVSRRLVYGRSLRRSPAREQTRLRRSSLPWEHYYSAVVAYGYLKSGMSNTRFYEWRKAACPAPKRGKWRGEVPFIVDWSDASFQANRFLTRWIEMPASFVTLLNILFSV